ncbi:hypothetical protein [Acinetobacter puyangensis]|uniref:hypothetical protein n=1 Tax=Acinetobacter puyangensis TaxID=1096779 RepID=UPI003A4DB007
MMRVAYFTAWFLGAMMLLSGCQSTNTVVDAYKILQQPHSELNTLYLSCAAAQGCDFARVDDVTVIDEQTHRPTKQAIERGMIRLEGSVFSINHQYALSLISGEHEVAVRFYPVSNQRAEKFHLIHSFLAGHEYKLIMFRQKAVSNGSLLNVAMPGALCVDLLQDNIALRRFCRPFNVVTGLGEFVEQRI